jgi:DNA mismatch endonuclease (patch repair protein)
VTDTLSPEERSRRMALIRGRNTGPEMQVRRLLHGMGYRYRLHDKTLPGKPDIVLPSRKAVIQTMGCWWHGHRCPRGRRIPLTRTDYWTAKIAGNIARDARNREALAAMGCRLLEVWECELRDAALPDRIVAFLGPPRRS